LGLQWSASKKVPHPILVMEFQTVQEWMTLLMEILMQIPRVLRLTLVMEFLTVQDFLSYNQ